MTTVTIDWISNPSHRKSSLPKCITHTYTRNAFGVDKKETKYLRLFALRNISFEMYDRNEHKTFCTTFHRLNALSIPWTINLNTCCYSSATNMYNFLAISTIHEYAYIFLFEKLRCISSNTSKCFQYSLFETKMGNAMVFFSMKLSIF